MEQSQQSAFLTGLAQYQRYKNEPKSKIDITQIKKQIKSLISRLTSIQAMDSNLPNQVTNHSIIKYAKNFIKYESIHLEEAMSIIHQLKELEKNVQKMQSKENSKKNKSSSAKIIENQIQTAQNKNEESLIAKRKKNMREIEVEKLKNQIQKQISNRRFLKHLKEQTYDKKKWDYILTKTNYAKQVNKKTTLVYEKNIQKQKNKIQQNYLLSSTFSNSFTNGHNKMKYSKKQEKKMSRASLTSDKLLRVQTQANEKAQPKYLKLEQKKSNRNNQNYSSYSKQIEYDEEDVDNSAKKFVLKVKNQGKKISPPKSEEKLQKYLQVLRRKTAQDESNLSKAVTNVVKKYMLRTEQQEEKEKNLAMTTTMNFVTQQTFGFKDEKVITETQDKRRKSEPDELEMKIASKLYDKSKRKYEMLQKKSQQTKEKLLKNRERFLKRRQQLGKQNQQKIKQYAQYELEDRQRKSLEKSLNNLKVQKLIRKRRQQGEYRQNLSQQIIQLRKSSDEKLSQKLQQLSSNTHDNWYVNKLRWQ